VLGHPSEQNNDIHEEEYQTEEGLDEAEMPDRTRGQTKKQREKEEQGAKHERKGKDMQKKRQKKVEKNRGGP
jgi:hypothetical protein